MVEVNEIPLSRRRRKWAQVTRKEGKISIEVAGPHSHQFSCNANINRISRWSVYVRHVDFSDLVLSLSSHRHSHRSCL